MGILRNIAGAFVELDDKPAINKPVVQKNTPSHPAIITMSDSQSTQGTPEYEEFRRQFASILADENKRNYPGNDYFEFVVMKNAMNAIPQEDVRYSAAFAGWVTGGNQSKKSLIDTANVYLGLVDKEIADFESAYKSQHEAKVGKNEVLIQQKLAKVQEMTSQIATLNNEIAALREASQAASASLVTKHEAFMGAGKAQREEILNEINKITQYIN